MKKNIPGTFRMRHLLISLLIFISLLGLNISIKAVDFNALDSFISKQLTKQQIRNYLRQSSTTKSVQSDARLKIYYKPAEGVYNGMPSEDKTIELETTLDMSANSILNFLNYGDEKMQVSFDAKGKAYGDIVAFSGEVRLVNETLYGIVKILPQFIEQGDPDIAAMKGKWYSYKIKNMDELRRLFSNSSNAKVNSHVSDEELDKLIMLLNDDVIQKRYTRTSYKNVDGVSPTCLNFKFDSNQLYQLVKKIDEIYELNSSVSIDDYKPVKTLQFSICTDPQAKEIYKSTFMLQVDDTNFGIFNIEFEQENYHHNQQLNVEMPLNAQSIDSYIDSKLSSAGINLDTIEEDAMQLNRATEVCRNLGGTIFPDITATFNEYDAILYAKANGIVNGYSDGCFKPYNEVTREQLVAILVRGKHTPEEIANCTQPQYPDVDPGGKLRGEVCLAKKFNYINGYADGSFRPGRYVTLEEASKMIVNVYGINNSNVDNTAYKFNSYMISLEERHALPGMLACSDDLALRADVAEIIYRLRNNITTKPFTTLQGLKNC